MKKIAAILMILGATSLFSLFVLPLWNVHLVAPQYMEGLGMDIYINDIVGEAEFDIDKINMMNHYIGMKPIPLPSEMWEMEVFPKVVLVMGSLGVIIGLLGLLTRLSHYAYLLWFLVTSTLGTAGLVIFNRWLEDYGSNLDPRAAIKLLDEHGKLMTYKPPLFGYQKMLNFDVWSYPQSGGFVLGIGLGLSFLAFLLIAFTKRKNAHVNV